MASRINELELYSSTRGEDSQLVDWSKAGAALTSGVATAAGMRELRRAENEEIRKSAEQFVEKRLNLTNQSYDKFMTNSAFNIKSDIVKLNNDMRNGRISRAQYKAGVSTIYNDWKTTGELVSNIDKIYADKLNRREKNTGSKAELQLVQQLSSLTDIKNKTLVVGPDGRITMSILDEKGNPTGVYQNVSALNNMMNTTIDAIDADGIIAAKTPEWKDWTVKNKKDIRLSGDLWKNNVDTLINNILVDDRAVAAILTDYGGFSVYLDDSTKAAALIDLQKSNPDATEADLLLAKQADSGYMNFEVKAEQLKKAQDILRNKIEQQFASEIDYQPSSGSRGGGGDDDLTANKKYDIQKEENADRELYRVARSAFNTTDKKAAASKLSTAVGGDWTFIPRVKVTYKKDENGDIIFDKNGDPKILKTEDAGGYDAYKNSEVKFKADGKTVDKAKSSKPKAVFDAKRVWELYSKSSDKFNKFYSEEMGGGQSSEGDTPKITPGSTPT